MEKQGLSTVHDSFLLIMTGSSVFDFLKDKWKQLQSRAYGTGLFLYARNLHRAEQFKTCGIIERIIEGLSGNKFGTVRNSSHGKRPLFLFFQVY